MTDLNDQEYAEVLRLELDRAGLRTTGHAVTDYLRMRISELDPPDPFAGLDDDQWVEVVHRTVATPQVRRVSALRPNPENWTLTRIFPEGDAREVLVIPVEEAREAVDTGRCVCGPARLIDHALAEHDERWSS